MLRLVLLLAGIVLLVLLLWQLGPLDVLDALRRIGWYFLPVFLLAGAHHATRALALRACVLRSGLLRYSDALAIRLSGEAVQSLTFTGPVLSQPTKAWLLEGHGLSLKEGFAATITEYLICSRWRWSDDTGGPDAPPRAQPRMNHLRHVENTKSCG